MKRYVGSRVIYSEYCTRHPPMSKSHMSHMSGSDPGVETVTQPAALSASPGTTVVLQTDPSVKLYNHGEGPY